MHLATMSGHNHDSKAAIANSVVWVVNEGLSRETGDRWFYVEFTSTVAAAAEICG